MDLLHTHRVFVPDRLAPGALIAASAEQAHHLLHVLRLKQNEDFRIFNGRDGEYRACIEASGKRTAQMAVYELVRPQCVAPDLWLCCAVIKKSGFDFLIEKSTEIGVSEIQPVITSRTQIREVNTDRAYNVAREAAEQSERLTVPAIGNPVALADFLDVFPKDRALIVCAERSNGHPVLSALESMSSPDKAAILTGPEGGFTSDEFDLLRSVANVTFISLGREVLRAETAALSALVVWQASRGTWR